MTIFAGVMAVVFLIGMIAENDKTKATLCAAGYFVSMVAAIVSTIF